MSSGVESVRFLLHVDDDGSCSCTGILQVPNSILGITLMQLMDCFRLLVVVVVGGRSVGVEVKKCVEKRRRLGRRRSDYWCAVCECVPAVNKPRKYFFSNIVSMRAVDADWTARRASSGRMPRFYFFFSSTTSSSSTTTSSSTTSTSSIAVAAAVASAADAAAACTTTTINVIGAITTTTTTTTSSAAEIVVSAAHRLLFRVSSTKCIPPGRAEVTVHHHHHLRRWTTTTTTTSSAA